VTRSGESAFSELGGNILRAMNDAQHFHALLGASIEDRVTVGRKNADAGPEILSQFASPGAESLCVDR
jgi:hypothetical protein